jgi:hypothetical protein
MSSRFSFHASTPSSKSFSVRVQNLTSLQEAPYSSLALHQCSSISTTSFAMGGALRRYLSHIEFTQALMPLRLSTREEWSCQVQDSIVSPFHPDRSARVLEVNSDVPRTATRSASMRRIDSDSYVALLKV